MYAHRSQKRTWWFMQGKSLSMLCCHCMCSVSRRSNTTRGEQVAGITYLGVSASEHPGWISGGARILVMRPDDVWEGDDSTVVRQLERTRFCGKTGQIYFRPLCLESRSTGIRYKHSRGIRSYSRTVSSFSSQAASSGAARASRLPGVAYGSFTGWRSSSLPLIRSMARRSSSYCQGRSRHSS